MSRLIPTLALLLLLTACSDLSPTTFPTPSTAVPEGPATSPAKSGPMLSPTASATPLSTPKTTQPTDGGPGPEGQGSPAMDKPTPEANSTPEPTGHPPFTCPTPAQSGDPAFTTLPDHPQGTSLEQVLARLPASYRDSGVWFVDYSRAMELSGAPDPTNLEEYLALSEAERDRYLQASNGLLFPSYMMGQSRQYLEEWKEAFGFDLFAASQTVSTGFRASEPFGATYLKLKFDTADVRQHLLDLGYQECAASGGVYYGIRHDRQQDLSDPVARMVSSSMNRVVLGESWMAAAPDTERVVPFLEIAAGGPTLLEDPVIAALAQALGDPLSAAVLPRQAVLEPEGMIEPIPAVRLEKPAGWGSLHQWERVAVGYSVAGDQPWWTFSLFYPDPAAAEADAPELVERMESYITTLPQLLDGRPLGQVCGPLQSSHALQAGGSVLTVTCAVRDQTVLGQGGLWGLVATLDLGFLLP